jgi:hypothetical protein
LQLQPADEDLLNLNQRSISVASLSPATLAASLANPVALGTLELGTDFDQFTAAHRADLARRFVTVVIILVHDNRCSWCRQIVEFRTKHPL